MRHDRLRLTPGHPVTLSTIAPDDTAAFEGKRADADAELPRLRAELGRLQELLYADQRRSILIVLQGMDTAGKDGVIRHVFEGVNPQGVEVASFRAPTPEEAEHDFLWRVHVHAPSKGHIAIFNRSHYEDVLVARVHGAVPRTVWLQRFRAINEFERELSFEGTVVLKFFLHISRDEQRRRLLERLDEPAKGWKLTSADLYERRFWTAYLAAYEDALRRTTTDWAPWWIIPSDHKWFRNWVVSRVLVDTLQQLKLRYPRSLEDPRKVRRALAR
jgi:PPK2 family polyphosphate:nucleotide phosphotransferase